MFRKNSDALLVDIIIGYIRLLSSCGIKEIRPL